MTAITAQTSALRMFLSRWLWNALPMRRRVSKYLLLAQSGRARGRRTGTWATSDFDDRDLSLGTARGRPQIAPASCIPVTHQTLPEREDVSAASTLDVV